MVFSWHSQSNSWLTIILTPAYSPFCFCSRRYADLATSFFISSQRIFRVHLRTKQNIIVKQQNIASVPMRPPQMPLVHSGRLNELRASAIPWSLSVPDNSLREASCMPMIFTFSFLISRVRLLAVWSCKCHLTFSQECSVWSYSWGGHAKSSKVPVTL